MHKSLHARIEHLEALYSEQEYTVQALSDMVAQQDRELSSLTLSIEILKDQIKTLKTELPGEISSDNEPPPHY